MPLTENERLVLGVLFDSETSPSSVAKISVGIPLYPDISELELTALQQREAQAILPLNEEIPSSRQIERAIAELTSLINELLNSWLLDIAHYVWTRKDLNSQNVYSRNYQEFLTHDRMALPSVTLSTS